MSDAKPPPRSRLGLILLLGLSLVAVAVVSRERTGTERVAWRTEWSPPPTTTGPTTGPVSAKPVLLDFAAGWCPPCREMARTTWADAGLAAAVADRCLPVRVDADARPELMQRYGVQVLPTLILAAADGRELRRVEGFQSADEVRAFLPPAVPPAAGGR